MLNIAYYEPLDNQIDLKFISDFFENDYGQPYFRFPRLRKTLRRVQLNSPNGLAYHLFTHMLYVPMLWTPARYRLQNIENCVLTVVRRFE